MAFNAFTWNVNSINARLGRLSNFLKRVSPDYLCLQELKCTDENFPKEAITDLDFHAAFYGQKTYNGVAIISKNEPTRVIRGFNDDDPEDDGSARCIAAEFDHLTVVSVYVPNGRTVGHESYHYKLRWYQRLRDFLAKNFDPTKPLILAGDFNVAPDDRDVYDPKEWGEAILCSPPERQALNEVLKWGLSDTFRYHHDEEDYYSWWDYRSRGFELNKGMRIDMVYATQPLLDRCETAWIERNERIEGDRTEKPSDHVPVAAQFGD